MRAARIAIAAPLIAAALLLCGVPMRAEADEAETLGGDLGGLRTAFAAAGLKLGIDYTGETFGVVSGGVRRGFVYDGRVKLSLNADLATSLGWSGATAHASAMDVQGRVPSVDRAGDTLFTVSNVEARPVPRLYELWLEQALPGNKVALRVGQIAADDEFMISDTASTLINATFGWPTLASANMTEGGPIYPLPTPGVRLRANPLADVTVLAGVFAGAPGGAECTGDPQICDLHGTRFSLSGGALWMGELQVATKLGGLPGTYKIGAWRETGAFPNQRTGANDKHGDSGGYAVIDQMVWRRAGTEDQGASIFLRGGGAPADRNLVAWYVDGGVGFKGPFAARPDDTLTLGVAYARISGDAAAADRAAGPPTPVRDYETLVELSYIARVTPWWSVQPDLQYLIHPGGSVVNPRSGLGRIPDTLVLGVRTAIAF